MGTAIAAMAALTAVGALGCLMPPVQGVAREALRYGSLACFGLVLWKLIDTPGANQVLEPRYGAFLAAARGADRTDLGRRRRLRAAHAQPHGARRRYVAAGARRRGSRRPAPPHRRRTQLGPLACAGMEIRLLRHGEAAGYAGDLGLSDRGRDRHAKPRRRWRPRRTERWRCCTRRALAHA